ncbi:histamine H2 receptor [Exaiptasia diaphana]|uniref:G-protein coupled receptors family 1 profile domain-containing protein n=1 Tax=Exaiptasia diaphana TaxID=2652724 RepID=A0A913Y609_EXADI|nr:histamine H2 receptor [Exaiptasia diaphana]
MVNNSSSVVVRSSSPGVCFLSIPQFDPHNMNRPDSVHPTWTFLVAVNGLAAPPTIVVNIFVILVVVRDENLRSASFNVLLTSLAVTDFLVGLLVEPLYCLFLGCLQNNCLLPDCTFTAYVCSFIFCGGSTIVSFTIASVERYLAIEHLNFYLKNITVKKVMITTVIAWVIHSAYLFITSVLLNESHPDQFKVPAAISVGILCMITLYCSSKVQLTAYRQSRIIARQIATVKETNNEQQQEQEQRLQEYKRVFTMTMLVALSFLFYAPLIVTAVIEATKGKDVTNDFQFIAGPICISFVNLQSLINPIIMALRLSYIRQGIKNKLTRLVQRNEQLE